MRNVTIIDDEKSIADTLAYVFSKNNFKPDVFLSAEEFLLSNHTKKETSAYIVDLNLPGIQGLEIIRFIRTLDKSSPIFIISGTLSDQTINDGLNAGADDYVTKPFNPALLYKKLETATNKVAQLKEQSLNESLKLLEQSNTVTHDGMFVTLTNREFIIVKRLLSAKSQVVTRNELLECFPKEITLRNIDIHIHSARKKLKKVNLNIQTCWGRGYSIVA